MAMACKICNSSKRLQIDRELASGKSVAKIARDFNVPEGSLRHHKRKHLNYQLVAATQRKELLEATSIMERMERSLTMVEEILFRNFEQQKDMTALAANREVRGWFDTWARLSETFLEMKRLELDAQREERGEDRISLDISDFSQEERRAFVRAFKRKRDGVELDVEPEPAPAPRPYMPAPKPRPITFSNGHTEGENGNPGVSYPLETGRSDEGPTEMKPVGLPPRPTKIIPKPDRKAMRRTLREMRAGNARPWKPE